MFYSVLSLRRHMVQTSVTIAALLLLYTAPVAAQSEGTPGPLLNKYCVTCHNDKLRTGGLSLQSTDLGQIPQNAETWEKVIRKLRVGAMPPAACRARTRLLWMDWRHSLRRRSIGVCRPSESGKRDHAPAEPRRVRQCHPRPAGAEISTPPRCCRPMTRAAASTTSPTSCECRRP